MKCPSCDGLFSSPMGQAEGGCYFCGVRLRITADIKVMREEDESGAVVHPGWEKYQRKRIDGLEERPMFVVTKDEKSKAVY